MSEPHDGLVMFCYDGSEGSLSALGQAASCLRPTPRLIVTAWQTALTRLRATPGFNMMIVGDESDADDEERRAAERAAAEGAQLAADAGLQSEHLVVEARGPIWEALVEVATTRHATLVVCGARGRASFHDLLFGRTSTGLLHHAPCPVLVASDSRHAPT